jgi:hypothetical protein
MDVSGFPILLRVVLKMSKATKSVYGSLTRRVYALLIEKVDAISDA